MSNLLSTNGRNDPIDFAFNNLIADFGTTIQANAVIPSFAATISAFDQNGTILGTFTEDSVNGSPLFIGIGSNIANIFSVEVAESTFPGNSNNFSVSNLSLRNTPVPEPVTTAGTLAAAAIGLVLKL